MIDFRSDTLTKPSAEMRRAMAEAEVGDEQYLEDPTVNRLQEMVAELTGKEAALFVPSGTMCNGIAFAVHCRPGDAVVLDRRAHPNTSEGGGPAIFAGVMMRGVDAVRGVFTPEQAMPYISQRGSHTSKTAMVSVENTSNQGGGKIWPLDALAALRSLCDEHGMKLHMDGARLMNASVGSDTPVSVIASYPDSVWIDLSKGLGAPVGAVLAGVERFHRGGPALEAPPRWRHASGGNHRRGRHLRVRAQCRSHGRRSREREAAGRGTRQYPRYRAAAHSDRDQHRHLQCRQYWHVLGGVRPGACMKITACE